MGCLCLLQSIIIVFDKVYKMFKKHLDKSLI